jgi:hypothetical protein
MDGQAERKTRCRSGGGGGAVGDGLTVVVDGTLLLFLLFLVITVVDHERSMHHRLEDLGLLRLRDAFGLLQLGALCCSLLELLRLFQRIVQ